MIKASGKTKLGARLALCLAVTVVGPWNSMVFPAESDAPGRIKAKSRPACILIWLEGGPPSIDMWDLKEGTPYAQEPFRPIATAGEMEICQHFPQIAQVMDKLSVIRSMSSRGEVDARAEQYMRTSFVPHPNTDHPLVGSAIARELSASRPELTLPPFVSLNGSKAGSGYLEPRFAPLVIVDLPAFVGQLDLAASERVLDRPLDLLHAIDAGFEAERGLLPMRIRGNVKDQTLDLLRSNQLDVFRLDDEDPALRAAYGTNAFGANLLLARRLVEAGVPFVEVTLPGWDERQDYFDNLQDKLFPKLDAGLSTLVRDLDSRGLLADTVIVVTGGFARTPRIRHGARDHWGQSWSLVVGGGGIKGGMVVGQTTPSGKVIDSRIYSPRDLWATVGRALGISLDTVHTTRRGRQHRIFNSGKPIQELLEP